MLHLKRNLLCVALASVMTLSAHAQAQTTASDTTSSNDATAGNANQATNLDTVTVTGIRRGIENAIETKRESTSIVESISAEDIGKLPDVSIAESISRLPGLTAQRVAGRSSTISIRGLSGDYGTTLLNGREQVSVGDNRTVEFDQYPAELINAVTVYKTPDASLIGQGLSGTVNLQTVRPLQFAERTFSVNGRLEDNSLGKLNSGSDDRGSRVSGAYIDQFADRTVGLAVGYARLDSPGQANRWEAWGYPTDAAGTYVLGGTKSMASSTSNVRQGLMGVLEFQPNDSFHSVLDAYYSKFEKDETTRFMETGLAWGAGTSLDPTSVVVQDGVVTAGTFNGVRPVLRNDRNTGDDKLFAIGWNNEFKAGDYWTLVGDVSYSRADRQESILETYSGMRAGVTDSVDFLLGRHKPTFSYGMDYTDPSQIVLTDPNNYGQDGYIKLPEVEDTLKSFRASAERSFESGIFSSLEFGANFSDREKRRSVPESFVDLIQDEAVVDPSYILSPVKLGFTGIPGSFAYDIDRVFNQYYVLRENVNADILNKQWTINEKVDTYYTQLNINTDMGGVSVKGNVGVQVVRTDQDSNGFSLTQGDAANATPITGGARYTDVLPSLNLAFGFVADQTLRLGLGRQMARPRIDQMRASANSSLCTAGDCIGEWTRTGGNPALKPWTANAADVSYEKYFGNGGGYVSAAYFYKDLRTYIYDQTTEYDFTGFVPPEGYAGPTPPNIGRYTRPANGEGGSLEGYELAASVPFDTFLPALEGFGLQANYSDTKSSIKRLGPDGPDEPIAGLSRRVTNVTLYFEKAGFSARVGARKRSDFLGEIQGFGADRAQVYIKGETVVDFQTGYAFQEGSLQGLSFLLQINNLTNEPYEQYFRDSGLTQRYEEYGRQVLLGVNYKF